MNEEITDLPLLKHGLTWQQLQGRRFRTERRTVTESDLITLITWAGITEPLFLDAEVAPELGYEGRLVPGVLTYVLAEGLIVQTGAFHGTGMAFLGAELKQTGPVFVGDSIWASVEIVEARPTSKPGRGVVSSLVIVRTQRGSVLEYTPVRLIKGDDWKGNS